MRTKRANIDDFMNRTKADLVSGYRKQVDFIESTAWEMVWFYFRQSNNMHKDMVLHSQVKVSNIYIFKNRENEQNYPIN